LPLNANPPHKSTTKPNRYFYAVRNNRIRMGASICGRDSAVRCHIGNDDPEQRPLRPRETRLLAPETWVNVRLRGGAWQGLQTYVRAARRCGLTVTRCCIGPGVCSPLHHWQIRVRVKRASHFASHCRFKTQVVTCAGHCPLWHTRAPSSLSTQSYEESR